MVNFRAGNYSEYNPNNYEEDCIYFLKKDKKNGVICANGVEYQPGDYVTQSELKSISASSLTRFNNIDATFQNLTSSIDTVDSKVDTVDRKIPDTIVTNVLVDGNNDLQIHKIINNEEIIDLIEPPIGMVLAYSTVGNKLGEAISLIIGNVCQSAIQNPGTKLSYYIPFPGLDLTKLYGSVENYINKNVDIYHNRDMILNLSVSTSNNMYLRMPITTYSTVEMPDPVNPDVTTLEWYSIGGSFKIAIDYTLNDTTASYLINCELVMVQKNKIVINVLATQLSELNFD